MSPYMMLKYLLHSRYLKMTLMIKWNFNFLFIALVFISYFASFFFIKRAFFNIFFFIWDILYIIFFSMEGFLSSLLVSQDN